MNNSNNYRPRIGKQLLKQLMFELYSDARTIYREYIQNALDSIAKAVESDILASKDALVTISIDVSKKIIKIRDNGTGIPSGQASQALLDISNSSKNGIDQAGQYGIGRLSGGGYCNTLVFTTSAKGEKIATKVTFDTKTILQLIEDEAFDGDAIDIIVKCTKVETIEEENTASHYFQVELMCVDDQKGPALLDADSVKDYLRGVAPVDYDTTFKNDSLSPKKRSSDSLSEELADLHSSVEKINLKVNGADVRKWYSNTVEANFKDKVHKIEYFDLKNSKEERLAWGWFAITEFSGAIKDSDKSRGLRLRKHNIQIGGQDLLNGFFKESRGNNYFIGEIFIVNPYIRPNSARDGVAPTAEWNELVMAIKEFFKELQGIYKLASDIRSAIGKSEDKIAKIKKSKDEKRLVGDAQKEFDKVSKLFEKAQNKRWQEDLLCLYDRRLQSMSEELSKFECKEVENSTNNDNPTIKVKVVDSESTGDKTVASVNEEGENTSEETSDAKRQKEEHSNTSNDKAESNKTEKEEPSSQKDFGDELNKLKGILKNSEIEVLEFAIATVVQYHKDSEREVYREGITNILVKAFKKRKDEKK